MMKKGILAVSFGTTYPEARESCIGAVERRIMDSYPQWEVRRAFSSNIVIKRILKKEGIHIDNPREALEKFSKEGFKKVIVQPLYILAGEEYEKVMGIVQEFEGRFEAIAAGKPLLYFEEDYIKVANALKERISVLSPDEKVLLMGHGTRYEADASYDRLQEMLDKLKIPAYIGTVEGRNRLQDIIPILKREGVKSVLLMPLMLVAGDHAVNDMAGEEGSWKAVLESEGFKVRLDLNAMGKDPLIQDIFIDHINKNL